jgi:GNAT superfamily N-acetyltransferase
MAQAAHWNNSFVRERPICDHGRNDHPRTFPKECRMHPALIKVRPARAADLPRLADLHRYAFRAAACGTYDQALIDHAATAFVALDPALVAAGRYWLIEAGGEMLASAGWSPSPPGWMGKAGFHPPTGLPWVRCLHVHPRLVGAGLGTRLLATVEADAAREGAAGLQAWVPLMSIALYRGAGFSGDAASSIDVPGVGRYVGLVMQRLFAGAGRAAA